MNAKVDPPLKKQVDDLFDRKYMSLHLRIGCNSFNNSLRGARDVWQVELGAAALLHTAAHNQLVVPPVHCQHLQGVEHEEEEEGEGEEEGDEEEGRSNEANHEEGGKSHLVEVVGADKRAVGVGVARASTGSALVRVKEGAGLHSVARAERLIVIIIMSLWFRSSCYIA